MKTLDCEVCRGTGAIDAERCDEWNCGMADMKRLIGRKILSVSLNAEKDVLALHFEDGPRAVLSAVGDCCSRSWFEHLSGLEALVGHAISAVLEREMPADKWSEPEEYELVRFYGWTLVTDYGRADLEMRNASNGYYGGDVEIGDGYIGQYGEAGEMPDMSPVTEDF